MVLGGGEADATGARWHGNGVLSEPDAKVLAGVLVTLAENRTLAGRMGIAGRALAAEQYRKEALVGNVDALYRELLETRRKR